MEKMKSFNKEQNLGREMKHDLIESEDFDSVRYMSSAEIVEQNQPNIRKMIGSIVKTTNLLLTSSGTEKAKYYKEFSNMFELMPTRDEMKKLFRGELKVAEIDAILDYLEVGNNGMRPKNLNEIMMRAYMISNRLEK